MNRYIPKNLFIISIVICLVNFPHESCAKSAKVGGQNWKIFLSAKYAYDDNVTLTPIDSSITPASLSGDKEDSLVEFQGRGSYRFNIKKSLKLDVDYSLNQIKYMTLDQYDLQTHTFGGTGTYNISNKSRFDLRYFYMYNILDSDGYNGIHYISPSVLFLVHPKLGFTRLNYSFQHRDNYILNSRDTDSHAIGVDQYIYFSNYKRRVRAAYAYRVDDTKESINDLDSHVFTIELKTPLWWDINLLARYRYLTDDYDTRTNIIGNQGLREDNKHEGLFELSRILVKNYSFLNSLSTSLKYRYNKSDSTDALMEYTRNIVSISLDGRF